MPKDVVYYYHENVGNFHYGRKHPMKPQRLTACNDLVAAYGLFNKMKVVRSRKLEASDILVFHSKEYVDFLQSASVANAQTLEDTYGNFNICDDCPVFDGMYDYCALYSSGSVEGARRLNHKLNDIVINWPGGLHHAKKGEASGFCYINDIVLGILELLKYHKRVLYIDIDIHHGDGVQEAFNNTDRVMTVSFHRFGNFFPGTGSLYDRGVDEGRYFAVNVPLQEGISDANYKSIFEPVIIAVMENYDPEAIVLQCGADSLGEDRLGTFNLSIDGHSDCVRFVKSFGRPMLVLGGGGYTLRNVARCWANETGVCLGVEMPDQIPETAAYHKYFAPGFTLKPQLKVRHADQNTSEYLNLIREDIVTCLRQIHGAPSVQMGPIPGIRAEEIEKIEDNDRKGAGNGNLEQMDIMEFSNSDEDMEQDRKKDGLSPEYGQVLKEERKVAPLKIRFPKSTTKEELVEEKLEEERTLRSKTKLNVTVPK